MSYRCVVGMYPGRYACAGGGREELIVGTAVCRYQSGPGGARPEGKKMGFLHGISCGYVGMLESWLWRTPTWVCRYVCLGARLVTRFTEGGPSVPVYTRYLSPSALRSSRTAT